MSLLQRIFGESKQRAALAPLYHAIVAAGRDPAWYRAGVPDSLDGRFDMIAALTALVLLRLETEGEAAREASVRLTETFIDDMDSSLRQIGIGDYVVGKHVGQMMSALGGRLGAFRDAQSGLDEAVRRNIFHDAPPSVDAVATVAARLETIRDGLTAANLAALFAGELPKL
ncbi:MAG: ubiquinol-cytochrome C chaperone family protein [Sphingosinicella sp.]|uniref:ubiquinol-cytochrome C chaperone family protein n=1 Tax=Sphingosinicella sp. TaxID=1917971 RepID=UPI004037A32F